MKKLCLLGLAVLFVACNNDKITDVLQISKFFAVRIDPQSATLAQGGTQALTVTAYDAACAGASCNPLAPGNPIQVNGTTTFRSTDTTVAKVDANGVVTAQAKAGTANIIGTLQNIPGGTSLPSRRNPPIRRGFLPHVRWRMGSSPALMPRLPPP